MRARARHTRSALIAAAMIGAVTGLVGAVLCCTRLACRRRYAALVLALGERRSRPRDVAAIAIVISCIAVMLAVSWLGIRIDPTSPWTIAITDEPGTRWVHLRAALDTIPAALAYVTVVGVALQRAWRAARLSVGATARAARGVAAGLLLLSLDALARDIEDQRALWILVGLAIVLPLDRNAKRLPLEPSVASA